MLRAASSSAGTHAPWNIRTTTRSSASSATPRRTTSSAPTASWRAPSTPTSTRRRAPRRSSRTLGEAYEVLKDPEKRAAYNELGANWKQGQDFRPPPNWDQGFEFSRRRLHRRRLRAVQRLLRGSVRPGAGGGGGRGGFARRVASSTPRARTITPRSSSTCATPTPAPSATITLRVPEVDDSGHVVVKDRTLSVTIPKGVREGQHIRLAGQGSPGMGKGQPGDLYLEVRFAPDPAVPVEGKDVYLDLPVDTVGGGARRQRQGADARGRGHAQDPARLHQGPHHAPQGQGHPRHRRPATCTPC